MKFDASTINQLMNRPQRIEVQHLNCGWLHAPPLPPACCHCLFITDGRHVVLVDTGVGSKDIADPNKRIGQELIDISGVKFIPELTAVAQLTRMGYEVEAVTDIVVTHCDHDHVGGLSDFPNAKVHVSAEELANVQSGNPRYCRSQFEDEPRWQTYDQNDSDVLGFEARRIVTSIDAEIYLIPLFGHTRGHCGVVVRMTDQWLFHVGDAYYLRGELDDPNHPIDELATMAAVDNQQRKSTLQRLRECSKQEMKNCQMFGYHDRSELPPHIKPIDAFVKSS